MDISGAKLFDLVWRDGRLVALSENDHILRRFGQVDVLRLRAGDRVQTHRKSGADENWVLIEGQADLSLRDLRAESPTREHHQDVSLSAETPQAVLIPFGVLAQINSSMGALLLRVSTHADEVFPTDMIFNPSMGEE